MSFPCRRYGRFTAARALEANPEDELLSCLLAMHIAIFIFGSTIRIGGSGEMDKILFEALLEMHTIALVRMKCLIMTLEEKGIVTRDQIDSIQDNLSQSEKDEAGFKVRRLFGELMAARKAGKP